MHFQKHSETSKTERQGSQQCGLSRHFPTMSAGNKNSLVHDNPVLRGKNNGKTTQSLVVWTKPYQLDGEKL